MPRPSLNEHLPLTIADTIESRSHIMLNCLSCRSVILQNPLEMLFKPSTLLVDLEAVCACPNCGASNRIPERKLIYLTTQA